MRYPVTRRAERIALSVLATTLGAVAFASAPALAKEAHVYASSFGAPCATEPCPTGQFKEPAGVAVNDSTESLTQAAAGDVYVVDKGDDRVERFSSSGVYLGQFNGGDTYEVEGKVETGAPPPAGAFSEPQWVAVDNDETSPSHGDVYVTDNGHNVVDKFGPEGKYIGQITKGANGVAFTGLYGLAVDPKGLVWIYQTSTKIDHYTNAITNEFSGSFNSPESHPGTNPPYGLAVDSEDNLYLTHGESHRVLKINSLGQQPAGNAIEEKPPRGLNSEYVSAPAVVPSTNEVLLDNVTTVGLFSSEEVRQTDEQPLIDRFGAGHLIEGTGLAVTSSGETVYVADAGADAVKVFQQSIVPDAATGEATRLPTALATESAAAINGTLNPDGVLITSCEFEYGTETSYGQTASCKQSIAEINAGTATETKGVSADLTGLEPGTVYHYRLVVTNANGESQGEDREFTASTHAPEAITGEATNFHDGAVTLNGTVNPEDVALSSCEFEYGTELFSGQTVPCEQSLAEINAGLANETKAVSAKLTGLTPGLYDYRLVAVNANGSGQAGNRTARVIGHPAISGESSSNLGATTATLGVNVDAGGLATTYRVEYGTSSSYGSTTQEVSAGAGLKAVGVEVQLTGLQPDTTYHYRFVVSNSLGLVPGTDMQFETSTATGATASVLPDGRVYQLVSPSTENHEVYIPSDESGTDNIQYGEPTGRPMAASGDGNSVAYIADPESGGNGSTTAGLGNEFLSTRATNESWIPQVLSPRGVGLEAGVYEGFTNDLSVAVVESEAGFPLTSEIEINKTDIIGECKILYVRTSDGHYRALFTKLAAGVKCSEKEYQAEFAGMSADGSHIAFEMPAVLTPDAPGNGEENLYEWVNGQLNLVNVLPAAEGGEPAGNAQFGGPGAIRRERVVSSDGSRLFWTDLTNHNLYMREDGGTPQAKTVLVAQDAEFQTASTDGSTVIFIRNGDLCSYDVSTEQTTDLAPSGEVQGVLGASEDGGYVYFAGKADLTSGATAGEPNLYLAHENDGAWEPLRFVATLTGGDGDDWLINGATTFSGGYGGLKHVGAHTAEVTPDGNSIVFMSHASLTGYDNRYEQYGRGAGTLSEVFVYGAGTRRLTCASCGGSGNRSPITDTYEGEDGFGAGFLSAPTENSRLPRWISEDGSRVFFDTAASLVPQDRNSQIDVYEWERDGTGSCQNAAGCIYLLSGGAGSGVRHPSEVNGDGIYSNESFFVDASASGNDVFFTSRTQLSAEAGGDDTDLYDAHVGSRPISSPACTGTGCQGVPPAPPIFATPSSVTFNGTGNFPPSTPTALKSTKKTAKCAKGKKLSHGKCLKVKSEKKKAKAKKARRASNHRRSSR